VTAKSAITPWRSGRTAEIDAGVRQVEIPHAPGAVHVHPPALLPADRADRHGPFMRRERDDALRVRLRHDRDLLVDRDHSCKREVVRYTEGGHRVLRVSVNGSLDNSILLNRGAGVHLLLPTCNQIDEEPVFCSLGFRAF
jgi:hypothetical protein